MAEARVALVTCDALPALVEDDRPLMAQLQRHGTTAVAVSWSDPSVDWTAFDAVVIRSCWDYHRRVAEFTAWLSRLGRTGVPLWNPAPMLRWNLDKIYLRDLEHCGIPVVPTAWCRRGSAAALEDVLTEGGWREAVVKPRISAAAHGTWRTAAPVSRADEQRFRLELASRDLMVQPLLEEVTRQGEWSLVFFRNRFSHAVLKRPAPWDFRVQAAFGGSTTPATAPTEVAASAHAVVSTAAAGNALYARVDGCVVDGRFCLMELELVEPALFLSAAPGATEHFARLIAEAACDRRARYVPT